MVVGVSFLKPRLPDSRPSRPSTTPRCLWAWEAGAPRLLRIPGWAWWLRRPPPRPAPNPPAPAPAGLPAPPPSRAGRGRRAAAPRARAGQRGLGSGRGFREVSPGRPRRSPWPDAQRGRDAVCHGRPEPPPPGPAPPPARLPPASPSACARASLASPRPSHRPGAAGPQRQPGECGRRAARAARAGRPRRPRGQAGSVGGRRRRRAQLANPRAAARLREGAPAPGSRRSPRRHRRQSARGGSPAGSPCLRAASRVRPRPSEPGRPASPLPGALVHFWVKGTRNVQQVRAVIIIFRRVRSARRAGTRCGGRLRGESPRPAPAAGSFVWPVTGPGRRVGDAGQRPPDCRSLLDGSLEAWGLGLPRVCGPVTSLQPLQESQRDGRAGWQGYLDVYLFLYVG